MEERSFECYDPEETAQQIARAVGVSPKQVRAAVSLLESGNTLPFIARYRKEATQGLNEQQLRAIEDAVGNARELAERKATVLKTIHQQGQLDAELEKRIRNCADKKTLEDLYLPYKPKRRTRATIARERGLGPLADVLLSQRRLGKPKRQVVEPFVAPDKEVPDAQAAIQGACDIVAEVWSEDADTRQWLAQQAKTAFIVSKVKRGKNDPASKFAAYFDHREPLARVPSHRLLAMMRGAAEGVLDVGVEMQEERVVSQLERRLIHNPSFEFYDELRQTVQDCFQRLLMPATESSTLRDLKDSADDEAIAVFASNLRDLLMSPPAGPRPTIGIDPGYRTGCKVAVVDETGKFLASETIYPTPPRSQTEQAAKVLTDLVKRYSVQLIAIGNGTASRETDAFVTEWIRASGLSVTKALVNESGASIYSASELAAAEYPDLDVTVRGAISIAHRLQDPLAELVKIDPKSIGVGQYQHDVNPAKLKKCLEREVESCVNAVGVDLNLASASLLSYVAGVGPKLAERIVQYRNENGRFRNRRELNKVPKLGPKAFEQAAGFLRIRGGDQPLDNSSVHPESYYVVNKMAQRLGVPSEQLVGNASLVSQLSAADFVDDKVGLPTVQDILAELPKPGRDPRKEFRAAKFADGVHELEDLKQGMVLEGTVTNVTRFGAFVDVGVHQDGLIHISELDDRFVHDPSEVVAVGDIVRVKVLEVDLERRRISLSRKQV